MKPSLTSTRNMVRRYRRLIKKLLKSNKHLIALAKQISSEPIVAQIKMLLDWFFLQGAIFGIKDIRLIFYPNYKLPMKGSNPRTNNVPIRASGRPIYKIAIYI